MTKVLIQGAIDAQDRVLTLYQNILKEITEIDNHLRTVVVEGKCAEKDHRRQLRILLKDNGRIWQGQ